MPFGKQSSSLNEIVRNHPVIVATSAATGGVLLGAFVMFQVFAAPHPRADGNLQAGVSTSKAQIETTGSAPVTQNDADKAVSSDCDRQTWPYLSPTCIDEARAKNRSARVVSTDKIDKPAVASTETTGADAKSDSLLPAPSPSTPTVSSTSPPVAAPTIAAEGTPQPAPVASAVAPSPALEATAAATQAAPQSAAGEAKYAGSARAAEERRAAKKSKRKLRSEQAVAERNIDDDDEVSAAAIDRDDRAGRRADRRLLIERLKERRYDVAEEDGGGRRRIIVIRRGGGSFESPFGMIRRGDDD